MPRRFNSSPNKCACEGEVVYIPGEYTFDTEITISDKNVMEIDEILCYEGMAKVKINFCPICGKKLPYVPEGE